MIKEKKLLKNYLLYFLCFIFLCLIGITGVFADTVNVGYITNNTDLLLGIPNLSAPVSLPSGTTNSYGNIYQIWLNINNITINKDYIYNIEISTPNAKLTNINRISIISSSQVCNFLGLSDASGGFPHIYFQCLSDITNGTLSITLENSSGSTDPITTTSLFRWNYTYLSYYTDDDDLDLGPVITNQTQNTQDIINNNNTNTQDIINNNDENTNKIIDENKKNFNDCRDSLNLLSINNVNITSNGISIKSENGVITLNGTATGTFTYDFILNNVINSSLGTLTKSLNASGTFSGLQTSLRNSGGNTVGLWSNNAQTTTNTISADAYRFRIQINDGITVNTTIKPQIQIGNVATGYEEFGKEICVNKLDEQKNAINNVDNTLKDDNVDDNGVADAFESFNDYLDDNSTITQLITLPITLYTAILNNLNGTCFPFNLGDLYGESLVLPCINISQYLGNSLWTMIDIIISGFAVYAISKKMIKVFNNFSSLREGDVIDD